MISCGALFGSFIFAGTLVISNVIQNSKEIIQFPKLSINKELFFYAMSLLIVTIFGFIGTSGYPFVIAYLLTYFTYIGSSLFLERFEKKDQAADFDDLEGQLDNQTED